MKEAIAVGMRAALTDKDSIISAYRCHGWASVCGWDTQSILAELFGKSGGCSLGKVGLAFEAMAMHIYFTIHYHLFGCIYLSC